MFSFRLMTFLVILVVAGATTSCERPALDDTGLPSETTNTSSFMGIEYSVIDGRVVILNKETAEQLVNAIDLNAAKAFNQFTNQTAFTSSRAAYLDLIDNVTPYENMVADYPKLLHTWEDHEGDVYVDHAIDYVGFEWLTNADGVVQVGSDVYDFSDRENLAYVPVSVFSQADAKFVTHEHSEATQFDMKRVVVDLVSPDAEKTNIRTCRDTERRRRVLGQLEASETLPWTSIDNYHVRTRFYKKVGAWFGVQAESLSSNWDLWVDVVAPAGVLMFPSPLGNQRFTGSHVASSGDRQNTRFRILEGVDQSSHYLTNAQTTGFPGQHRSQNFGRRDGRNVACDCNLR